MPFLNFMLSFVLLGGFLFPTTLPKTNLFYKGNSDSIRLFSSDNREIHVINSVSPGYKSIIRYKEGFIATGSEGKIDWISVSGKITKSEKMVGENFNSLLTNKEDIIVGGDHGTIMISSDKEKFRMLRSGTDKKINSLALFQGIILAGTNEGEILSGDEKGSFNKIYPAVKGNIVSLSARESDCYGVTDEGEIIHTTDGVNWDVFDFNEVYAGYYKPCTFTSILATEKRIAVAGINEDETPVMMFSNQGNVWTDRALKYSDEQGIQNLLTEKPNNIFYDDSNDLFYLACNNGKLMKIPSCSHCNKMVLVSEKNLAGISGNSHALVIVGENFYVQVINPDWE